VAVLENEITEINIRDIMKEVNKNNHLYQLNNEIGVKRKRKFMKKKVMMINLIFSKRLES